MLFRSQPHPIPRSLDQIQDGSGGRERTVWEEEFGERELKVVAVLADLPSIMRVSSRQQQLARPEIPSWGRRRPRKALAAPPAEKPAADDDMSEGIASPDTPLAFSEGDDHDEAAAAEDEAKASAQDKVSRQATRSAPARLPPPIRAAGRWLLSLLPNARLTREYGQGC